jgi:hypothetical protein
MAMKKIRLDFSKTEERSGWNTRHISEGLYKMKIDAVQETEAQDGTAMLVYALVPTDSRFKSRRFPYYCKLQQNQLWKLRDLLVAAGQSVPKKAQSIDPSAVVGKYVAAEVEDDSYQGNVRSSVNGTYGLDILDEGAEGEEPDEEEDEEYDESEDDADEGYEDEAEDEEDEEDEEEDLSTLSLVDLRKRAKTLGVETAGLKKAELIEAIEEAEAEEIEEQDEEDELDEDDLDDEELEDEEFEDDEEPEEKPAPRRRPAAKATPARRAAPARRTVKRR